jgi:hypothetical protein
LTFSTATGKWQIHPTDPETALQTPPPLLRIRLATPPFFRVALFEKPLFRSITKFTFFGNLLLIRILSPFLPILSLIPSS